MTEKQIETQILTWLNYQKNTFAFKVNTVGVFDPVRKVFRKNKNPFLIPGTSDIIGCHNGNFFAIEVKTPKTITNISDDQSSFLSRVANCNGKSVVVGSLDSLVTWFKQMSSSSS